MQTPHGVEAGLAEQAAEALRNGQDTYTGAQVAVLLALAFHSGIEHGRNEVLTGHDHALGSPADQIDAMCEALGGPSAKTLKKAVHTHIALMNQKHARGKADRTERPDPQLHGLHRDDPDWPPVAIPGTKPTDPSRCPATAAPDQNSRAAA